MVSSWAVSITALLAFAVWRVTRRRVLSDIRGPAVPSRLLGHEKVVRGMEQVGDLEFKWVREFGPTWLTKNCYGEDNLWTADPKALQYVFHTSGYRFSKRLVAVEVTKLFTGQGILSASADDHQRHRKIMNPAFGAAQLRTFLPIFRRSAARLGQKWKDQLQANSTAEGGVLNISRLLARMTLDVIGEVAFDDRLGALDDKENELAKSFDGLFLDTLLYPPSWDLLFKASWRFLPTPVMNLIKYLPTKEYKRFREYLQTAFRTGKNLIEEKASATEKGNKDIMSILVQSNLSEDARFRLNENEILSQIATLLVAGHDTTANSLTWLLYELSKHPEDQRRIRDEIAATRERMEARNDEDFSPADLDSMTFMNAAIKEVLRLHPIVPTLVREADQDDVIPLAIPIETKSGKVISEIPIVKGTPITASICTYNRLESVWGEDAAEWNPNRFVESRERTTVGIFANLMTFSAGIRGCIGWRFAVLEMQAVLAELIETFDFRFPDDVEIIRLNAGLMVPMVRGKMQEGIQIPLHVSVLR
ncbi:cytochrome P450 [Hygrophoropsis aurantiaca]|uniref:Cytochrome P450 n=1 Tax=Hygrophoropsis aurantiaca TaxID=72124 RepID=A0ACB8A7Q9_9AGAM|nr:cytochrome P450 [Hygrophoropsis aurantiaca]